MTLDFKKLALDVKDDVIRWRHDFHENPELSFKEVATTQKVANALRSMGYEKVEIGVPRAPEVGVIADLNPGKPGKCIALRADMDALPVHEETGLLYASKNDGVMHACGHDSHIARYATRSMETSVLFFNPARNMCSARNAENLEQG